MVTGTITMTYSSPVVGSDYPAPRVPRIRPTCLLPDGVWQARVSGHYFRGRERGTLQGPEMNTIRKEIP